jgi:hypothetical protein
MFFLLFSLKIFVYCNLISFVVCGCIGLLVRGRDAHVFDSCNKAKLLRSDADRFYRGPGGR